MTGQPPLIVVDDDPTGTQAVAGVPVLLEWDPGLVAETAAARPPAIHLMTNARAYSPSEARELTRSATAAAVEALGRPRVVLRGDSTLRGHLLDEYLGLCEAAYEGTRPPLLLVPALPAAGRVTVGGVHLLERDGVRVPLHETEYARDPSFAYRDARLLRWAEERSSGLLRAVDGSEVPLERLRSEGAGAVAEALLELAARPRPAACAPDAETLDDLATIAEGLRQAEAAGAPVAVRCAPTFAGVLGGCLATRRATIPHERGPLVVVCGSWVPASTRQLARLVAAYPSALVEVDVLALASTHADEEIERAARDVSHRLAADDLAVLATPRERPDGTEGLAAGHLIAVNLARVLRHLDPAPAVVVAKGGVTSAVTAREGLGARRGEVVGPLLDGVALWRLPTDGDRTIPYVVFPGNVGGDDTLRELVDLLRGG
jgi:uncharacterized protein YgbK (DUF1537 family)